MMRCLMLLVVAGVALAADPKPCCMKNKWHGLMVQVGALKPKGHDAVIADNVFMMDYNYDDKMIMLAGSTLDTMGHRHNLTVFDNFAHGKRYTVYDGACTVAHVPTDSMTPPCIPGNFTFEGSYKLGGGNNSMMINSFSGYYANAMMHFAVTDDCIPVTMHQYGSNPNDATNDGFIYSFEFANVKQGQLSQPNPFTAPTNCKDAPATVG